MTTELMIDHTNQPATVDGILVVSTHLTEEDIPDHHHVHLTQGLDPDLSTDANPVPAVNCWDISIDAEGTLTLWSHAPMTSYPAYPHILFSAADVKELLAFLKKHEQLIEEV